MKRERIRELIKNQIIILDGAMGTELQKLGMKPGICPELLNIESPDMIYSVNKSYVDAGSNIISANTFGANRAKLEEFGLEAMIDEINKKGVEIARKAADGKALVFGDVSSTGRLIEPMGNSTFDEIYEIFAEQARILEAADVDGVIIETMTDIKEMKAAVIAFRDNTDLPIFASMSFLPNGRTVTGTDPATAAVILEGLDIDVIGINCSVGADIIYGFAKEMAIMTKLPVFVQPNAGIPRLEGDKTIFDATPQFMAEYYEKFREIGVGILGGCCGTTPEHIKALSERMIGKKPAERTYVNEGLTLLASKSGYVRIGKNQTVKMLGERINPNALKRIKEDIAEYRTVEIRKEAVAQMENGAEVLDVNVGLGTIDEPVMMKKAVMAVENVVETPIAVDTTDLDALEAGLKACYGKPLVNSVMGKGHSLETVLPLVKKYGAAVLGLVLDENGIPATAEERRDVALKIIKTAEKYGIKRENILIDTLVLTASAEQDKVMETVKAIKMIKDEFGVNTVLGISNISFGLPSRSIMNAAFLSMCIGAGLDMPIMNPMSADMKNAVMTGNVLTGRDRNAEKFIAYATGIVKEEAPKSSVKEEITIEKEAYNSVLSGSIEVIESIIEKILAKGEKPLNIVNNVMIPAITEVGDLYEKGKYYLPQLIMSADTMKKGVERLKKEMSTEKREYLGKVVFATVKNDIHDIGKNIVCVLMENNGFEIIDLGKDVDSEIILEEALNQKADIVGLSALMTTTMVEMRKTIHKFREKGLNCDIMIGGAVVNPEFAEREGVYYSKDAVEAVKVAKIIMEKRKKLG